MKVILIVILVLALFCVYALVTWQKTASWYGPGFHGRKTASGEIFNMDEMTAAHKKLPFGTKVQVTYKDKKTGEERSVVVRINDRGPYVWGRHIDLSRAAAEKLGILDKGVAKVRIRILEKP